MTHTRASLELSKEVPEFSEVDAAVCHVPNQGETIEQNHYGPRVETFAEIPKKFINVAGQMRDADSFDDGGQLKHNIQKKGLINPFVVYEMSEEDAREYVDLTNDGFDADIDFDDFVPNENGRYYILVAGERRFRSIEAIEDENGVIDSNPTLTMQIRKCESLGDLLDIQFSENVYNPPAAYKYAAILHERYLLGKRIGEYETVADFVKDSPASERTSRNAMKFFNLPKRIRELVATDIIPYYHAIDLEDYASAKKAHLEESIDEPEVIDELLYQDLVIKIGQHLKDGSNRSLLRKRVKGWKDAVKDYQLDLADLMLDRQLTEAEIAEKQIAAQRRNFVNTSRRDINGLNQALAVVAEYDPTTMASLSANVANLLTEHRELLAKFVELHQDTRQTKLAEAITELAIELDLSAA